MLRKTDTHSRLYVAGLGKAILMTISIVFTAWVSVQGKYSSVIHYNQTNGLPGTYGYNIFQDHLGYIWISTENGIARFNGYDFKTFTTKDGLPDNELFDIAEDKYGRLWFAPFTNNIGYIKNEKIYHRGNDAQLRRLQFKNRPECILLDKRGNIFLASVAR